MLMLRSECISFSPVFYSQSVCVSIKRLFFSLFFSFLFIQTYSLQICLFPVFSMLMSSLLSSSVLPQKFCIPLDSNLCMELEIFENQLFIGINGVGNHPYTWLMNKVNFVVNSYFGSLKIHCNFNLNQQRILNFR